MRVLIQTRPGLGADMTGDVTQTFSTAEALERLGVEVRFSDLLEPDVSGIDVVHLFSTLQPHYTYLRLKYLKEKGVPVAVSTIYWEWEPEELKRESIIRLGRVGYHLSRIKSFIRKVSPDKIRIAMDKTPFPLDLKKRFLEVEKQVGLRLMRKFIYENAEVLLPNSHTEYHYLVDRYGIQNDYVAVPNAVDPDCGRGDAEGFQKKFGLKDFVLCVAAVQGRKNHIRLIRAMKDMELPLVIVGPQEPVYTRRCRAEASARTHFIGELRGDDLRNAYAAARVHALVSFYETPGLSSLEAAIADNVIVVSDRGCTRDYFQEDAFYCNPNSVESIKGALLKAVQSRPSTNLKERILREYNWDKTAEKTLEGYETALKKVREAGGPARGS